MATVAHHLRVQPVIVLIFINVSSGFVFTILFTRITDFEICPDRIRDNRTITRYPEYGDTRTRTIKIIITIFVGLCSYGCAETVSTGNRYNIIIFKSFIQKHKPFFSPSAGETTTVLPENVRDRRSDNPARITSTAARRWPRAQSSRL